MGLRQIQKHTIDILFPLTVLLVFGACSVLAILLAANIYSGSVEGSERMYNSTTALAYVQEKLHQNDAAGCVRIEQQEQGSVLVLQRSQGSQEYCTYIYAWEGSLRELMANREAGFQPSSGRALMDMASFECRWTAPGLLEICCTDAKGRQSQTQIALMSGEE